MANGRAQHRVLVYSHDSFGLGHLRRCRAIAHALVDHFPRMSVLILSGSPIIGNFDFQARVEFVRVPGVIKLRDGEYTSGSLDLDVEKTLEMLKRRGTPLVLGLRDVMDEPALLAPEWQRKNVLPALTGLYDEIWVYGLPQVCNPLADISLPRSVEHKIVYTGYLRRTVGAGPAAALGEMPFQEPYLLITTGGGGDGEALIDWVIRAYEWDRNTPHPALIVFGPFMQPDIQTEFLRRVAKLPNVHAITFDPRIETLIDRAVGVVAMGGYNTFCEILSFDKPAIIVPRTMPRREQLIRAERAQELGLVKSLLDNGKRTAQEMATALRHLPQQGRPSEKVIPGLLDGLTNVNRLMERKLKQRPGPRVALAGRSG